MLPAALLLSEEETGSATLCALAYSLKYKLNPVLCEGLKYQTSSFFPPHQSIVPRSSETRWAHCGFCIHRGHAVPFLPSYPECTKTDHEPFSTYSKCSTEFTPDQCFVSWWPSHSSSDRRSPTARFTEVSSPGSGYKGFFLNPGDNWGWRRGAASLYKFHYASCLFLNIICLYCLVVISESGSNFVYIE